MSPMRIGNINGQGRRAAPPLSAEQGHRSSPAASPWRGDLRILPAVAVVAASGAMLILANRMDSTSLDYRTGMVPVAVPWLAAAAAVVVAAVGLTSLATTAAGTLLSAALVISTGWSATALLFDALRAVRLVPLPLSWWGLALRLLLLLGAAAALWPIFHARVSARGRCPVCRRWLPGTLARIPRWPAAVGVVFSLPYPVMRVIWILGGTLGTTGGPVEVDRSLQLALAAAGAILVVLAIILLINRGPTWLRTVLGLSGLVVGSVLATTFGPAAAGVASMLVTTGPETQPGEGLMLWVFALFYVSWVLAGSGVALGGLRYWTHRRNDCGACRDLLT